MRRDWLLYLVVFSLALNVGTLGALFYFRYHDGKAALRETSPPPPMREILGRLNLRPEQRQTLASLAPEHRRRLRGMRQELLARRRELVALLKAEPLPAWPLIQDKVREISSLQGQLEEEVVQHLLKVQQVLDADQRTAMAALLEERLPAFAGAPGRDHRGRRWRSGTPPGPPECPMPPPPPMAR